GGDRGARLTAKARAAGRVAQQAQARARAADIVPTIKELQAAGFESLRGIAIELDERGIPTARGGKWSATQVARLLEMTGSPFDAAAAQPESLLRARLPALPNYLTIRASKSSIVVVWSIFLSDLPARASKSLIAVSRVTPVGQQKNIYFETSK